MDHKVSIGKTKNKIKVFTEECSSVEVLNQEGEVVARVISDNMSPVQTFFLDPGKYTVVTDGNIDDISLDYEDTDIQPEAAKLLLESDAKDFHVVDGVGEIFADGESFALITVTKLDSAGKPLARSKDNDELFIRTNAGYVRDEGGKSEIRSVKLKKGQASFRLYSEAHKRLATLQVLSSDISLENASINIEFI